MVFVVYQFKADKVTGKVPIPTVALEFDEKNPNKIINDMAFTPRPTSNVKKYQ
jgi:hypothetical protein